jgi:hypothetical protein
VFWSDLEDFVEGPEKEELERSYSLLVWVVGNDQTLCTRHSVRMAYSLSQRAGSLTGYLDEAGVPGDLV